MKKGLQILCLVLAVREAVSVQENVHFKSMLYHLVGENTTVSVTSTHRVSLKTQCAVICSGEKKCERFLFHARTGVCHICYTNGTKRVQGFDGVRHFKKSHDTGDTREELKDKSGRILLVPAFSSRHIKFRQMNILNKTVHAYPFLDIVGIYALTYDSKQKRIIIGTRTPSKIITSTIDTTDYTIVNRGVSTYSLAVDGDRQIIFLFRVDAGKRGVFRMTTKGEKLIPLLKIEGTRSTSTISVLTVRRMIFLFDYRKVKSLSYDGGNETVIVHGHGIFQLTIDPMRGILYYIEQKTLMKMVLSQNITSEVTKFKINHRRIQYNADTLYMSVRFDLGVLNLNVTSEFEKVVIGFTFSHDILLCFIP